MYINVARGSFKLRLLEVAPVFLKVFTSLLSVCTPKLSSSGCKMRAGVSAIDVIQHVPHSLLNKLPTTELPSNDIEPESALHFEHVRNMDRIVTNFY